MKKLVVGTHVDYEDAWRVAKTIPGLALCTYPSPSGVPKTAGPTETLILDYRSCPGTARWLSSVRQLQPAYAITPPVGSAHTWEFLRPYCTQANLACSEEVLVLVTD